MAQLVKKESTGKLAEDSQYDDSLNEVSDERLAEREAQADSEAKGPMVTDFIDNPIPEGQTVDFEVNRETGEESKLPKGKTGEANAIAGEEARRKEAEDTGRFNSEDLRQ